MPDITIYEDDAVAIINALRRDSHRLHDTRVPKAWHDAIVNDNRIADMMHDRITQGLHPVRVKESAT